MVARFAGSNRAVMTTDTGTDDFIVIQRRNKRQPGIGWYHMAGVTIIRSIRMTRWFALSDSVVMTANACT